MNDFEKRIRVNLGKNKSKKNLCVLAYEKLPKETEIDISKLGPGGVLGTDLGRKEEKEGGYEYE